MSAISINPFDLLDENGGPRTKRAPKPQPAPAAPKPVEAPKPQQAAQTKPAASKPAAGANSAAPAKKDGDRKPRPQGDAPRGNRNAGADGAVRKAPAQQPRQQQAAPAIDGETAVEKPRERRDRDHRTHDRPHARGRQFDRRSGTGRPANENKKGGSGKGNWGNLNEEGQEVEAAKEAVEGEKLAVAAEGEAAATEAVTEPPKEPEKELLTLDEYYAQKKSKAGVAGVEAPKIRQAGEGVDQSAWANYAPIEKEEEEVAPTKEKDVRKKEETSNKVDANKLFKFYMPPAEGMERRGRGKGPRDNYNRDDRAPRGRGDRQERRPQQDRRPRNDNRVAAQKNIAIADQAQFPSLGGSAQPAAPAPVKA